MPPSERTATYIAPEWRVVHGLRSGRSQFEYRTKDALGNEAWIPVDRAPISNVVKVPEQFLDAVSKYLAELPSDASEVVMAAGAREDASPLEREVLDGVSARLLDGAWMSRAKEG